MNEGGTLNLDCEYVSSPTMREIEERAILYFLSFLANPASDEPDRDYVQMNGSLSAS